MAKVEPAWDARLLVGIDLFKHRRKVLIAAPDKSRGRRLTITNRTDGFIHRTSSGRTLETNPVSSR